MTPIKLTVPVGVAVWPSRLSVRQLHVYPCSWSDGYAWAHICLVADDMPAVFVQPLAEPLDNFPALAGIFRRIIAPGIRHENLGCAFGKKFWPECYLELIQEWLFRVVAAFSSEG